MEQQEDMEQRMEQQDGTRKPGTTHGTTRHWQDIEQSMEQENLEEGLDGV